MLTHLEKLGLITHYHEPYELRSDVLSLIAPGKAHLPEIRKMWRQMDSLVVNAIGAENAPLLGYLTAELTFALGGHVPGSSRASQENQSFVNS